MRRYMLMEDARRAFEPYAVLEPELWELWELCRGAAPPRRPELALNDGYDLFDPFESDPLAVDKPDDGWCAEEYFCQNVKRRLLDLVGRHRRREPRDLQTNESYDIVHDLLINCALARPCACCIDHDDDARWHREGDEFAAQVGPA